MSPDQIGYPPFNTPKPVAERVWVVDAPPIRPGGLPVPVRMTVIKLADGGLWLHSPTAYDAGLAAELERLGPIRHLLAPSFGHWMFLQDWSRAYPEAKTWAAPGVRERKPVRRAGVRIDHDLAEEAPPAWAGEIDQVLIASGPFSEVEFFHRPSRTLVLTDLVQNLEPRRTPAAWRGPTRLLGITAPHGKAPAYLRALLRTNRRDAAEAAGRLVGFGPERVIFAHGRWFEHDATARLRDALAWLIHPAPSTQLDERVVVITGASSGIGRAAALAFARRGARLALAARRADVLEEVARECEALGGQAIAVAADVTDPEAMERLAQAAVAAFGRIDVWINNAGVGVFGRYEEADLALHRRTVEVNLMGAMHGAYAALPVFLRQNKGVLINNISLGAWSPTPFAAAYTASKFGLRGFTASLRQELAGHDEIHVCGVFPAMVDTPGFVHGANMSGADLDPGPLLYRPEDVAETFVRLADHPRAETAVGWPSRASQLAYAVAPVLTERAINRTIRAALARARPAPRRAGALLTPIPAGVRADGGWLRRRHMPSARVVSTGLAAAGAVGLGLAAAGVFAARRNGRGR
jgi:short-subunit dehydrogenase